MTTFIQFTQGPEAVFNVEHIVRLWCEEKVATSEDVATSTITGIQEGQIVFLLLFRSTTGYLERVYFIAQEYRDQCYHEILAVMRPIAIGAKEPANAGIPTFSTQVGTQKDKEVPTPKSPRKPRAKKGEK